MSSESPGFFDEERINLGREVANQVAIAISQSRLLAELQELNMSLEQRVAERTAQLLEANEQLQELDEMKDMFVANVSHELRTPLTSINLYLQLLAQTGAARLNHYLPILRRESDRLTVLIEDLLNLSRLEHDHAAWVLELRPLDGLLAEVIEAHMVRIEAKRLLVSHKLNSELPEVLINYASMMQVFTNLISNAVAYTSVGGRVAVTIVRERIATRAGMAVKIHNSGPPISTADLPHLFERFYRGQTGRESGEPGTGLGLAICKEIVERHRGRISVTSAEGFGCEFVVWLPMSK